MHQYLLQDGRIIGTQSNKNTNTYSINVYTQQQQHLHTCTITATLHMVTNTYHIAVWRRNFHEFHKISIHKNFNHKMFAKILTTISDLMICEKFLPQKLADS